MTSPAVSVLLTCYNRRDMLDEAIKSVLAQTYGDYELIILDDNSSDASGVPDLLARYRTDPRIRLYKDNVQPAERGARVRYAVLANIGLALARGHYVTYLCDDDLYLPGRLAAMTARLGRGDCQVVYGSQHCESDGRTQYDRLAADVLHSASFVVDHSSVMHTAAAAREVGGWDDNPAHWAHADAVFWDRLTRAGHLFYPVREFTDIHRFHPGSVTAAGIPA